MAVNIRCDRCGRSYSVTPQILGRKVQCKGCGNTFVAAEPQPELVKLESLNDLTSVDAVSIPVAELASMSFNSGGLTSQAIAPKPRTAPGGVSKGVLIALAAGGGVAVLLVLILVVSALTGGDDAANGTAAAAGAPSPASVASSADTNTMASTGGPPSTATSGATLPVTATENPANTPWSVSADPAPVATRPLTSSPLPTGNAGQIFFARRDAGLALACRDDYSVAGGVVRAEKFDLSTGKSLGGIDLPAKDRALNFSLDGSVVLAGSNGNSGSGFETVRVWSWSNESAKEAAAWVPYPNAKIYKTMWAGMPRADLVLTLGGDKELIAWSFPNPQERYKIATEGNAAPLLTPGGKYFAVHAKDSFRFYETATGKPAGQTDPGDGLAYARGEAFHPAGDRLAALCPTSDSISGWRAYVWDVKTGKISDQADVVAHTQGHIQFCEPPFLLAGNTLIDLERGEGVWKYEYFNPGASPPDTQLWFADSQRGEYQTYARTIPSPDERAKIDAAWANVSVVIPQGSSLSIEAAVPADAPATHNQAALIPKAAKKLEEAGYQVAAGQPQSLRLTVSETNTGHTIEFRNLMTSQVVAQVPDRRLELKVALLGKDGKEVWTRGSSFGPMMMTRVNPADTSDPVAAIFRQRCDQVTYWLDALKIPSEIRSTMTADGLGSTKLQGT